MSLTQPISTAESGRSEPLLISIVGHADVGNALAFEHRLQKAAEGPHREIVIDFSRCDYVDSVVLAILIKFVRTAAASRAVLIADAHSNVRKSFRIVNLERLVQIVETFDEAVAVISKPTVAVG